MSQLRPILWIIGKDLRHLYPLVGLLWIIWAGPPLWAALGGEWVAHWLEVIFLFALAALALVAYRLARSDPLTDGFLSARPVSPVTLAGAKLLFVAGFVVAPLTALHLLTVAALPVTAPTGDWLLLAGEEAILTTACAMILLFCAYATRTPGGFITWSVGVAMAVIFVGESGLFHASWRSWNSMLTASRELVALIIVAAGMSWAIGYGVMRMSRSRLLFSVAAVSIIALAAFMIWPINFVQILSERKGREHWEPVDLPDSVSVSFLDSVSVGTSRSNDGVAYNLSVGFDVTGLSVEEYPVILNVRSRLILSDGVTLLSGMRGNHLELDPAALPAALGLPGRSQPWRRSFEVGADTRERERIFEEAITIEGEMDILVRRAGIVERRPLRELDEFRWNEALRYRVEALRQRETTVQLAVSTYRLNLKSLGGRSDGRPGLPQATGLVDRATNELFLRAGVGSRWQGFVRHVGLSEIDITYERSWMTAEDQSWESLRAPLAENWVEGADFVRFGSDPVIAYRVPFRLENIVVERR